MASPNTNDHNGTDGGLAGRVLIAMPHLTGEPFKRSVVMICSHDTDQAFGLVLNKPIIGVRAKDAVQMIGLEPAVAAGELQIFRGGPVDPRKGFILHTPDFRDEETIDVPGGFSLTANRKALKRLRGDQFSPRQSRLFAGFAGWAPSQLDSELRRRSWLDVPASHELVFNTPVSQMWSSALDMLGISQASLFAMHNDPSADSRPLN